MERTLRVIRSGIDAALHTGAQLYVWQDGKVMFDDGIGEAFAGAPMTRDSINLWWSSSKPFAAVAVAQLRDHGKLDWDDPVSKHIPEFGVNGKDAITIRHILTHTGGFRAWPGVALSAPWDEIVQKICQLRLEPRWIPGEKAGYHARTGWFILAEIIRRLDGRMFDQYAREEIFLPLGMIDTWMSIPPDAYQKYAREHRLGAMKEIGITAGDGVPSETDAAILHPGGSGRGPIRELGVFYKWMMSESQTQPSLAELIRPQRTGLYDHTFKHIIDWGLGFIVNSQHDGAMPYGFGKYASASTFGHSGAQSSCGVCDPENKLIVAWVCNGMPGDAKHQERQIAINEAIYEDLR